MKEIPISEFKAKCSSMIERVRRTRRPIRITCRGKAIAEIVPLPAPAGSYKLGKMKGSIMGDIVSPVVDPDDFEVLRD